MKIISGISSGFGEAYLRVEVKETVVFEPQQKHLVLLHILFHQGPGRVQPPVRRRWIEHLNISSFLTFKTKQNKTSTTKLVSPLVDFRFIQKWLGLVEFDQDVWRGDWLADSEDAGVTFRERAVPEPGGGGRQRAAVPGVIGRGHCLAVQAWTGVDAP